MCRLAAYLGPPRPLATLLYEPAHSLQQQAHSPRELQHGIVNVDGTGVVWWPEPDRPPLRYVSDATPWADPNLPALAPRLEGRVQLAAVRSATPGIPFGIANVAPFVLDDLAMAHNGWISGFRAGAGTELWRRLPPRLQGRLDAVSDSLTIFATILATRDDHPGAPLADVLAESLRRVAEVCHAHAEPATLNVVLTDGVELAATRVSIGFRGNSLYTLDHGGAWPDAIVVASEPLDDDPAWTPVPDGSLLRVVDGTLSCAAFELPTLETG